MRLQAASAPETINDATAYQEIHFALLEKAFVPEPLCLKKYSSQELNVQAIPIHKIRAETERML